MDDLRRDVTVQRYYPNVLASAKEFKALAAAENPEYKLLWDDAYQWFLNTFVNYIDESGAKRWEDMLGIIVQPGETLEERKAVILARMNTMLPYTIRRFKQILDALYGEDMVIPSTNTDYELWLDIDNTVILKSNALRIFARSIIPANLTIMIKTELTADSYMYIGGKVSMLNTIGINTNTDITINDMGTAAYIGAAVSMKDMIQIKSEAI